MGQRGPVPNRSDDLARPRDRKGGSDQAEITRGESRPYDIPAADPDWHPIAMMMWESLWKSGQSDFYQQSDVAFAYSVCEDLSRYKAPLINRETGEEYYKRSGQMLASLYSAMGNLLITEADRRRVRIELEAPSEDDTALADLHVINGFKQILEAHP